MYILLIYVGVLLLAWRSLFGSRQQNLKVERTVFIAVMAFFMLRLNMGADTKNYMLMFNSIPDNIQDAVIFRNMRFPLFSLMMYAVKSIGGSYFTFTMLVNLIVIPLLTYTMYKESRNLYLSLLVFLGSGIMMVYYTSAMRQMICMAVFFFAYYECLQKDHYAAYYLCVIPLVFIQEVAIVALFIPLFYYFRSFFTGRKGYIVITVLGVIGIIIANSGNIVSAIIPSHFADLLGMSGAVSILGIGLQCALLAMVLGLAYFADKESLTEQDRFQIFLCVGSFLIYFMFVRNQLASRASDFIQVIYLVLLPKLVTAIPSSRKRMIGCAGVMCIMTVLLAADFNDTLHTRYFDSSLIHYPYVTIFNMQDGKYYYAFGDLNVKPAK